MCVSNLQIMYMCCFFFPTKPNTTVDELAGFQDTRLGNNICFFPQSFVQTVCQRGGLLVNTWACTPNSCGNTKLCIRYTEPGIIAPFRLFATKCYINLLICCVYKIPRYKISPQNGPVCCYLQICASIYLSQHSEKTAPDSVS